MKKYEKIYVGKGVKVENLDIIAVTLKFDELEQHTFEYNGVTYLKFEVARMMKADSFGKTHTAYVVNTASLQEQKQEEAVVTAQEADYYDLGPVNPDINETEEPFFIDTSKSFDEGSAAPIIKKEKKTSPKPKYKKGFRLGRVHESELCRNCSGDKSRVLDFCPVCR